ncbi:MAG: hypothetical protein ACRD01_10735 [Terriglobales bacterium]
MTALEATDQRAAELIERCQEIGDSELRADVVELLQLVLELHRQGLARMLRLPPEAWRQDEQIGALAELHGLSLPGVASIAAGDFVPLHALKGA